MIRKAINKLRTERVLVLYLKFGDLMECDCKLLSLFFLMPKSIQQLLWSLFQAWMPLALFWLFVSYLWFYIALCHHKYKRNCQNRAFGMFFKYFKSFGVKRHWLALNWKQTRLTYFWIMKKQSPVNLSIHFSIRI